MQLKSGNLSCYKDLKTIFKEIKCTKVMLVSGKSIHRMPIIEYMKSIGIASILFDLVEPNPRYELIELGIKMFRKEKCDVILAVGGGSAIDVAKCIKIYANDQEEGCFLKHEVLVNEIPFIAIPTTAGTGSEATHFAVIYYKGEKQSVADKSMIPDYVILDPILLNSLPYYQRYATMLDALCHAIESIWSIHATNESISYATEAIQVILQYSNDYLNNVNEGNIQLLLAANLAGKAINISKTTAAHAMSYKLTTVYGIAHGHAVALCLKQLWEFMVSETQKRTLNDNFRLLKDRMLIIQKAFQCNNEIEVMKKFNELLEMKEKRELRKEVSDISISLSESINVERMRNMPIMLKKEELIRIYQAILKDLKISNK